MAGELVYAFRIMRLPLLDAGGAVIGRLDDIVIIPAPRGVHKAAPRVLGFVATSQRRRNTRHADATTELKHPLACEAITVLKYEGR